MSSIHSSTPVSASRAETLGGGPQPLLRIGLVRRHAGARASLWIGGAILFAIALLSVIVPIISPYPVDAFVDAPNRPPSWDHPFGTDTFGRDLLVRVFAGGRIDLLIAAVGVGVPLLIGTLVGTAAGASRRRWPDVVLTWLMDAIIAFPFVILVLALVLVLGIGTTFGPLPAGLPSLFLAIFAVTWAIYARLARGQTLSLRDREYVDAARILGYSHTRIVFRHLLPTVLRTTATYAVADAIMIIIVAASLPFLGAGVQPPTPEWGAIMFEGRTVLESAWWITIMPGAVLVLTGIGVSLIADALIAAREEHV